MNIIKTNLLRTLLACCMTFGVGQAPASPAYHVTIDTVSLAGQSGYLDFLMLALGGATPVEANITNLVGNFSAGTFTDGSVSGSVAAGVTLDNSSSYSEFAQWANFGGLFSFDVDFAISGVAGAGTNLSVALLDASFGYLGSLAEIVTFSLQPGQDNVITNDVMATVRAGDPIVGTLPEPGNLLLVATGLMLAAISRRRGRG